MLWGRGWQGGYGAARMTSPDDVAPGAGPLVVGAADLIEAMSPMRREDGTIAVRATALAMSAGALLIVGAPGSGKSGLAAQFLRTEKAGLIADDIAVCLQGSAGPIVSAPRNAPALIELRGIGLLPVTLAPATPLRAVVFLSPSRARLPETEDVTLLGTPIEVVRHPYRHDAAAKIALWFVA